MGLLADDSFLALLDDLRTVHLGDWLKLRGPGERSLAGEGAVGPSHDIGRGVGIGDLGDHAVPDLDVGEAGWIGKHQDGVQGHLVGPYSDLVGGETDAAGLFLGKIGFGWFEGGAVCCASAQGDIETAVLLKRVWYSFPLDLGLDHFVSWDWG